MSDDGGMQKKKNEEEADLDITPMIDVTFLLLIFFMVTSTMKGTPDLDIPPAKHGVGVEKGAEIQVRAPDSPGSLPTILIDKREVGLEEVGPFVNEELQGAKDRVIIMADREVPHGFVAKLAQELKDIEDLRFFIGVRDKDR